MSDSRRRKLPWHQRPRAWIRGWLYHVFGAGEERELTDDHGNHIGGDLPPVRYGHPVPERVVPAVPTSNGDWAGLKGTISRYNPAWAPCALRHDMPRPVVSAERSSGVVGPGCLQNVPRPDELPHPARTGRWPSWLGSAGEHRAATGPGHLTMWDQEHVRSPWTPRPDDTIIQSGPRLCAGRIALLAGAS